MSAVSAPYSGNRNVLFMRLMFMRAVMLVSIVCGLLVMQFGLDKTLAYVPVIAATFFAGVLSVVSWFGVKNGRQISDKFLIGQLLLDVAVLLVLLWFTGRSSNPFIYYLLVITAVSASIFSARAYWAFCFGSIAIYTGFMYVDTNQHLHHMPQDFQLHLVGMWLNFVGSALLLSFFISRLATALRDRQIQLAAAREQALENEQLLAVGTLAASTVHSLGTPLSTLMVTLGELKDDLPQVERDNYINLMQGQIERCKNTMNRLSLLANIEDEEATQITLGEFVQEIDEYFLLINASPLPLVSLGDVRPELAISGGALLRHALMNLIENAVQAADEKVLVQFSERGNVLQVSIANDGEVVPASVLDNWGKPLASTKEDGLGIGIFLANSTIEKRDGKVKLYSGANVTQQAGFADFSTRVVVELPISERDDVT